MSPLSIRIAEYLTGRTCTRNEVAEALGATAGGVDGTIVRLVKMGALRKINRGWGKSAQYTANAPDACCVCATDKHARCGTPGCACECMLNGPCMARPREIMEALSKP